MSSLHRFLHEVSMNWISLFPHSYPTSLYPPHLTIHIRSSISGKMDFGVMVQMVTSVYSKRLAWVSQHFEGKMITTADYCFKIYGQSGWQITVYGAPKSGWHWGFHLRWGTRSLIMELHPEPFEVSLDREMKTEPSHFKWGNLRKFVLLYPNSLLVF